VAKNFRREILLFRRRLRIFSETMKLAKWATKYLMSLTARAAEKNYDEERSRLPERRVGRVRVYGADTFAKSVEEALELLQRAYPYGYSLVQRYIRGIVQSDTDPGRGTSNAVIYRKTTADGSLGVPANWFAAALVRRAIALRKLHGFQIWRSIRSAHGSLNRELHAMRLLECDSKYFHRQTNQILRLERRLRNGERADARDYRAN
jgi:hypothetical protein